MDGKLDLNEHLIRHRAATFYCYVSGDSMKGAGIFDDDLLIVDRAAEPEHGSIVVAVTGCVFFALRCVLQGARGRERQSSACIEARRPRARFVRFASPPPR